MRPYLSPKLDIVFKMIFGNEHNMDVLGDFLLTILDIPEKDVEEITVLNPFVALDEPDEKKSVLDLKVRLKSGRRVNVEIQIRSLPEMVQRLHYYKAKMVTEQMASGDPYTELMPTSCIAILDYQMYDDDYCHHAFQYYDKKRNVTFSDNEEIHILEIPKLERDNSNPKLADWLKFLNTDEKEVFDMLAEKSAPLRKAVGILAELSADEKSRMIAEAREKEWRDQMSRENGVRKQVQDEIITKLLAAGFDIAAIAKATELDVSEIEKLKQ